MAHICKNLSVQVSVGIIFVIKLFALYLNHSILNVILDYYWKFHWKFIYYLIYLISINLLCMIILTKGNCYHWNVLERNTVQHNKFRKYDFTKIFSWFVVGFASVLTQQHFTEKFNLHNFLLIVNSHTHFQHFFFSQICVTFRAQINNKRNNTLWNSVMILTPSTCTIFGKTLIGGCSESITLWYL